MFFLLLSMYKDNVIGNEFQSDRCTVAHKRLLITKCLADGRTFLEKKKFGNYHLDFNITGRQLFMVLPLLKIFNYEVFDRVVTKIILQFVCILNK